MVLPDTGPIRRDSSSFQRDKFRTFIIVRAVVVMLCTMQFYRNKFSLLHAPLIETTIVYSRDSGTEVHQIIKDPYAVSLSVRVSQSIGGLNQIYGTGYSFLLESLAVNDRNLTKC